jgi:putative addiction module CopG family antidote
MSRQTMSFALPESMREYIDNRVAAGNYGNTSEYIRDLVRRDQEEQAVGADPNLSHRADRILSQGWKPTLRWSAVDKFSS